MFAQLFIPLILVLLFLLYMKNSKGEVTSIKSTVDNRSYIVQNKKDKKDAANLLAQVRFKLVNLIDGLKNKHSEDDRVTRLVSRFNPDRISEGNGDSNYTSYTLNKGEKIVFCLRTRDTQDHLHHLNLIVFVAIHELAHVMTKSQGHTPEFNDNFKFLIETAVDLGVYTPENFRENPTTYCGIAVTDTPLDDSYFK